MSETDLTTEVSIPACNVTLAAILANQYGKLEAGEARAALEAAYQQVWNQEEFERLFNVIDTHPPYVTVSKKESQERGTMMFIDSPRFYFLFNPTTEPTNE